jgi:cysteine synthase B
VALYESALDLIGNTPIVDISSLSPNPRVRILAKLEGQNPGGSVKDRAAKQMIVDAEKDGILVPGSGQVILESSSGNTGIALAMISKVRGYTLKVVLPDNVSTERRQLLASWGAEIIDSPGDEGSNGAMRRAQAMAAEHPEWWFPFQYGNSSNPKAHYEGTGPEIWRDVPEVTHFVAGLGTSGTLMGVGHFLKERNPDVQIWAIEPPAGEMVDGLKNIDEGFIPPVFLDNDGYDILSRRLIVRPRESIEWVRRLTEVGIFAGISSGAILAGAVKAASLIDEGTIVMIVCDGGWKYLSAGVWTDDLDVVEARAKATIYFWAWRSSSTASGGRPTTARPSLVTRMGRSMRTGLAAITSIQRSRSWGRSFRPSSLATSSPMRAISHGSLPRAVSTASSSCAVGGASR